MTRTALAPATLNPARLNTARFGAVTALTFVAFVVAMVATGTAASAHTTLVSESPADGDIVTEAADVRLEFSEELLDIGNSVTLSAADGTTVDLPIDLSVPRVLTAPLPADLTPGEYSIDWRVVANDGHPLENSVAFTYAPVAAAPTAVPTAAPTATPTSAPSATPSASASASQAPATDAPATDAPVESASATPISAPADDVTDSGGSVIWWVIGIGAIVGAAIGVVVWRTGRTSRSDKDEK